MHKRIFTLFGFLAFASILLGQQFAKLSHLRQSRIAIWVKKEGIRKGQYKAGFRRVMSAEKYLKADLTDLKNEIKKHHPL